MLKAPFTLQVHKRHAATTSIEPMFVSVRQRRGAARWRQMHNAKAPQNETDASEGQIAINHRKEDQSIMSATKHSSSLPQILPVLGCFRFWRAHQNGKVPELRW
jgi:CHASE2 domain-containing sensor protein